MSTINTIEQINYLRNTVSLPENTNPCIGDCGNASVDDLAKLGSMRNVWSLLNRFPLIKANDYTVWVLQRRGDIRRLIETSQEYVSLRTQYGPQTREEWELLAKACMKACGYTATVEDLYLKCEFVGYPWSANNA